MPRTVVPIDRPIDEVRQGEQPVEWKVWDTLTDTVVFGAESMTESAATDLARRLNDAWRRLYPSR